MQGPAAERYADGVLHETHAVVGSLPSMPGRLQVRQTTCSLPDHSNSNPTPNPSSTLALTRTLTLKKP